MTNDQAIDRFIRSVGYLRRGEAYERGDVDERVFERLCELTQEPWSPYAFGGVHMCDLCRFTGNGQAFYQRHAGEPDKFRQPGLRVSAISASCDTWIAGDGLLWKFPTSITHYIDAHEFAPPADFCAAVLRCPPMRSIEYFKALLANGARELGFAEFIKAL